jgi:Anti-sigma-28 factor, FlgM
MISQQRAFRITSLRARIDRAQYHVDVDKVAEAILGRPTARLLILSGTKAASDEDAEAADEDRDAGSSQDVLEAA